MNGLELADATATRLRAEVPSRTVYVGAVPDGTLPARYLVVRSSEGAERATRAVDAANVQTPYVWVTSVARSHAPQQASREAAWGAGATRRALRDWRPDNGWRIRSYASVPVTHDPTEVADSTFYAVEQFRVHSYV